VAANIPLGSSTLNVVNTGPALQPGDSFDLFDGTISGPVPTVVTTGNGFAQVNYVWDTSQLLSSGVITVALNPLPLLPLETTEINLQSTTLGLTWNSYPSLLYTIEYSFALFTWAVARADVPADGVTNSTTALLDTAAPASSPGVTLAQYQMGTPNAQIQDAGNLVAAGPLTGGAGLVGGLFNTAAAPGPAYASAPVLQVNYGIAGTIDLATAMANQSWFTFALTVGTNVTDLDLTSLTFNAARGGGATQRGYGAYVILPDLSEVQLRAETLIVSQRPTWSPQSIDLTGVPGLQNLTAGQVITFKIAHFSPATSNSCEYDDITVKGDVSPGFPPPFAGADQLFLRIKQQ
jgi:hypothetical protein